MLSLALRKLYHSKSRLPFQCSFSKFTGSQNSVFLNVSTDGKKLYLTDHKDDGNNYSYHAIWLRHHCQCSECMASTGQRTIPLNLLRGDLKISTATIDDDKICIDWSTDDKHHSGYINTEWLKSNNYSRPVLEHHNAAMEPTTVATSIPIVGYHDVMESDEGLWRWLYHLNNEGLCLVTDVPIREDELIKLGNKISFTQKTIYGLTFDVRSEQSPINIAYTNVNLGYHMDLSYYQSPPGLQLFHCLKFDSCVEGGESILLDVYPVVNEMRKKYPKQFHTLTRIPVTFQKIHFERENPVVMIYRRPHIVLDRTGRVVKVNWAPSFEGPLAIPEDEVEEYYDAYCTLDKMFNNSPLKLIHRLSPGELLSINNQRILHGRTSFVANNGERHMKGSYINIDEFYSKLNVLSCQLGKKEITRHVLNGSSYL